MAPPVDLHLDDRGQIARVRRELNRLGDKELKKALFAGLNRATKPMREAAQREAAVRLPRRGGLAARVAREKFRTTSSARGVAVVGSRRRQLKRIDQGFVRHPVFGNREVWVTQRVPAGFFSDPMQAGAPIARREVVALLDEVAREAARRASST